jgi:predicted ATPase
VYSKIQNNGVFFVLEGEAGIGKTRLGEEFCRKVSAQGSLTVSSQCYPDERELAYGPIVESLRKSLIKDQDRQWMNEISPIWLSEAARLLPELYPFQTDPPPAPPLDNPGARSRFYEAVCQIMGSMTRQDAPTVFFFDDVHWADEATISLLTYLVRRLEGRPIVILVTWRGELVPPDHHLRLLLSDGQRAGYGQILKLMRLRLNEVEVLIQNMHTGKNIITQELSQRLYIESEGLPFFITEYLSKFVEDQSTQREIEWEMPHGVRNLLSARLSQVDKAGLQLLQAAAVIGRSFDFATIQAASGRSEEEAISALDNLLMLGMIREIQINRTNADAGFNYDFHHNKLRSLISQETSLARRMLLHRRVAESLVQRTRKTELPIQAGQIARHFRNAGRSKEAAEFFKLAGEHAQSLYANEEALIHYGEALALGHVDKTHIHQAMGDLLTLMGDYSKAIASYETAASLAESKALPTIEYKLGTIHQRRGEWQLAGCHFQAALEALEEANLSSFKARLYADWSLAAQESSESDQARDLIQQALSYAEYNPDTLAQAQVHNISGILARYQKNYEVALSYLNKSLDIAAAQGDLSAQMAALNNLSLVHADQGEYERAITLAQSGLDLCKQIGDRHRQAALENNLADFYHASGQEDEAMIHLKQAVIIFTEIGEDATNAKPEIWMLTEW